VMPEPTQDVEDRSGEEIQNIGEYSKLRRGERNKLNKKDKTLSPTSPFQSSVYFI
jgi:hypothetical protein